MIDVFQYPVRMRRSAQVEMIPPGPWIKQFAWIPRKIHGEWYWLRTIYKRRISWPKPIVAVDLLYMVRRGVPVEYGNLFDVLKSDYTK